MGVSFWNLWAWLNFTPPYYNGCLEYGIGIFHGIWKSAKWNIPEKLVNNIKPGFSKYGIFQKFNATTIFDFFRNMEYSSNKNIWLFLKHGIFRNIPEMFGIWNIPKNNSYNKNIENFGIWNILGIFKKKVHNRNMKILEYRNIPKNLSQRLGA